MYEILLLWIAVVWTIAVAIYFLRTNRSSQNIRQELLNREHEKTLEKGAAQSIRRDVAQSITTGRAWGGYVIAHNKDDAVLCEGGEWHSITDYGINPILFRTEYDADNYIFYSLWNDKNKYRVAILKDREHFYEEN